MSKSFSISSDVPADLNTRAKAEPPIYGELDAFVKTAAFKKANAIVIAGLGDDAASVGAQVRAWVAKRNPFGVTRTVKGGVVGDATVSAKNGRVVAVPPTRNRKG